MDKGLLDAYLAAQPYNGPNTPPLPQGITPLFIPDWIARKEEWGFYAQAFRVEATGEVVVAIRGTIPTLGSINNAGQIVVQALPQEQVKATSALIDFVNSQYG